jgi:hypothetical protein
MKRFLKASDNRMIGFRKSAANSVKKIPEKLLPPQRPVQAAINDIQISFHDCTSSFWESQQKLESVSRGAVLKYF